MKKLKDRKFIKKLFALKDSPEKIARGFALGSFIGMIPIPGFQWMLAVPLAHLLKWNKKAAFIAVFNTNIMTGALIFAFNFWIGKMLLGLSPEFTMPSKMNLSFISQLLSAGSDVFLCMLAGGIVVGIPVTIISYYIVLSIYKSNIFSKEKGFEKQ